jgi:hypothetical protein
MDIPTFTSRAEAFDYMLTTLVGKGEDIMTAAEKAEAFADIVCRNRALPDKPKTFVQQCVGALKEVSEVKREYPEMWEIVSGVLGGVVGVLAGSKASKETHDDSPVQPLDFDNMQEA